MNKEYWDEVFKLFTGRTHDINGERYADVLEPEIEEMIKDVRNKLSAIIDVCGEYWSHNLETIFITSFYEAMYAYNNLAKPQEEIDITGSDLGRLAFKFDQLYCDGLIERCGWSKELRLPEAINKCNKALNDKPQLDFSNVKMIKQVNIMEQIKIFNSDNLTTAIKSCYEKPCYNLLIVAPKFVIPVGLIVIDRISKLYPHERSKFKIAADTMKFPNGSLIRIINQNITARGYRVHEILMSDLSNEELIQVLEPMIRNYEEDQRMRLD